MAIVARCPGLSEKNPVAGWHRQDAPRRHGRVGVANDGYCGIAVRKDAVYDFRCTPRAATVLPARSWVSLGSRGKQGLCPAEFDRADGGVEGVQAHR